MLPKDYKVELLDNTRTPIARIINFVPIDNQEHFIDYTTKLSAYGSSRFRVATKDPMWTLHGDIVQPHANHIRISCKGSSVWQGVIVDNPSRTSRFIETLAYEYEYLLSKALIRQDKAAGNGEENYRLFKTGTLSSVITTIINEAKADYPGILGGLTIGTIDNPVFPKNFTDINNAAIGGQPWVFSDNFQIKFDYRDIFYVINQLAIYSLCDWEITKDFVFNFRTRIGTDKPELVFEYSKYGMIEDYNAPRTGRHQANHIIGIAADTAFNILKAEQSDAASITKYGKLSDVAAYGDIKNVNLLRSRLTEEVRLASTPDQEIHASLNQHAYPLGQYGIGDSVTLKIKDRIIQVDSLRHIVGIEVKVHDTGREIPRLITNQPRIP